jgi:hypothetical protein
MFWRFFKLTKGFLRIKAGKNLIFRFFVLQGKNLMEEKL